MQAKIMADGGWKTFDGDDENMAASISSATRDRGNSNKAKRFSPGIPSDAFFKDKLECGQFDLILTIRFLVRPLLPLLPKLLAVGGYLVISHFVEDGVHTYDQPRKDHRLQLGELAELYGSMDNVEVVTDVLEQIEDGRPINSVIIKKTGP